MVIITTKKGQQRSKPQLNLNYYIGISTPNKEKVLNAEQYNLTLKEAAQTYLDAREKAGEPLTGSDVEQAQAILNNPDYFGDTDTDWLDLVLRTGLPKIWIFRLPVGVSIPVTTRHYLTPDRREP